MPRWSGCWEGYGSEVPLLLLIKLYQWTISPLLGPVCRYYPSCSHYGYTAVGRHGAIKVPR